jgi:predicted nucleic acid-binding protein
MATQNASLFAVDTNFLLDLAGEEKNATKALDVLRKKTASAIITTVPTVLDELAYGLEIWKGPKRALALKALTCLKQHWGIQSIDFIPAGHGLVELAADRILNDGLLPEEERNDAFIIAEAALMNCSMLITSDRHLLDIDNTKLRDTLKARDLGEPSIRSPRHVISMFGF